LEQIRFLLLILLIGIVFSAIVLIVAKFAKNRWLLKYIPVFTLLAVGVACFIKARWFSEGMEGLGYIILAIIAFGGCTVSLLTALIVDIVRRYKRKRI
jgi:hypothetical protein